MVKNIFSESEYFNGNEQFDDYSQQILQVKNTDDAKKIKNKTKSLNENKTRQKILCNNKTLTQWIIFKQILEKWEQVNCDLEKT